MLIFTAKLDKKKAVAALLGLAIVICAVVLTVGHFKTSAPPSEKPYAQTPAKPPKTPAPNTAVSADKLANNSDRITYLQSLGWQVEEIPLDMLEVTIPAEFAGAYEDYAKLQTAQGFNLANYAGERATRYTYRVLNYPTGEQDIVADIIVCGSKLIAGDIQSPSLGGFMEALIQ
ncbi:MAG: DUF4830 domain-containing protein [Oscillospiraceae bacterium]|jgi:hypothetical protein|nr:DUF4830 domain-containing protein [Oscillospiraceae bacterium]